MMEFESTARKQVSYFMGSMNKSKEWANERYEQGEMSRETRDDLWSLTESWIQYMKSETDAFVKEYYSEET